MMITLNLEPTEFAECLYLASAAVEIAAFEQPHNAPQAFWDTLSQAEQRRWQATAQRLLALYGT